MSAEQFYVVIYMTIHCVAHWRCVFSEILGGLKAGLIAQATFGPSSALLLFSQPIGVHIQPLVNHG